MQKMNDNEDRISLAQRIVFANRGLEYDHLGAGQDKGHILKPESMRLFSAAVYGAVLQPILAIAETRKPSNIKAMDALALKNDALYNVLPDIIVIDIKMAKLMIKEVSDFEAAKDQFFASKKGENNLVKGVAKLAAAHIASAALHIPIIPFKMAKSAFDSVQDYIQTDGAIGNLREQFISPTTDAILGAYSLSQNEDGSYVLRKGKWEPYEGINLTFTRPPEIYYGVRVGGVGINRHLRSEVQRERKNDAASI